MKTPFVVMTLFFSAKRSPSNVFTEQIRALPHGIVPWKNPSQQYTTSLLTTSCQELLKVADFVLELTSDFLRLNPDNTIADGT
jgi:hypothetical protein